MISSAVTSVNNYIRDLSTERGAFQFVIFVPVVGLVAQLWKRQLLINEINSSLTVLHGMSPQDQGHRECYNKIGLKIVNLTNFDRNCFNYGSVGDLGLIVGGLAKAIFNPVGLIFSAIGLASLVTRSRLPARDMTLLNRLENHKVNDDSQYRDFRTAASRRH